MQRLEVSGAVRLIYRSLVVKGLIMPFLPSMPRSFTLQVLILKSIFQCLCRSKTFFQARDFLEDS